MECRLSKESDELRSIQKEHVFTTTLTNLNALLKVNTVNEV